MTATMNGQRREAPNDQRAEEALLGAMLLARSAIEAASEVVRPADFYKPAHVHVYDAILGLYATGEPVDPITVADELARNGTLETIGGPAYLVGIQSSAPAISNAGRYGRIIYELALLRRMIGAAGEIAEMAYGRPEDVRGAADAAQQMIFDLVGNQSSDTVQSARQMLDDTLDTLERLYEGGQQITGTPTGFVDLDELMSGLQPATVTILAGRPGMGKTAMGLNIAAHVALVERRPVWFQEAEMNHGEIMSRMLASTARVDSTRLRNGRLSDGDWEKIGHTVGTLADAPIWVDDSATPTVMDIRAGVRRLKATAGDVGLVVIDHAGLVAGPGRDDLERVSAVSRGVKIMAKELHVPVLLLCQLNRGVEQRSDKRPTMSDLRSSGTLEQDADNVLALYRDEVYFRDSTEHGIAEVICLKQRNGPAPFVTRLAYLGQYTKFASMARS